MPKHLDIKKHPDYWAFLNHLADSQDANEYVGFDSTTAKVFADLLQEHGDARYVIARNATRHYPGDDMFGMTQAVHPMDPHPERVGTVGRVRENSQNVEAFKDNAHSAVGLLEHYNVDPDKTYPVLRMVTHIPKTSPWTHRPSWPGRGTTKPSARSTCTERHIAHSPTASAPGRT